ncbi:dihydrolipoamide acetyltransferase family protein [Gallaecimonas kandeliae]|uniref:dihydrolipoamide acetyltransferase family protein n=1 Tax=Gallaecimonas kandeliae TaxID=3029055 RepID=UPI0026479007|nr:dihydrolipoamide acetyltransferase family protein [Gallaecimonas kandeliae]WKE64202.1 dihydrolipoamide acetyltransferase family protein [Gallaecimonas kandeliae]
MKTIKMPSFGSDMAKGTVAQWLVKEGDQIERGDVIATIDTMKGLIDMEVFDDGILHKLLVPEGTQLAVGEPIAELRLTGEAAEAEAQAETKRPAETPEARPRISPAARHRAEELGIDWQKLGPGSGPEGALVLEDIEAAPRQGAPGAEPGQQMRQAIAAVVSRSKREIPHYYLEQDIPLEKAQLWLAAYNQDKGPEQRILANALIYCALARAVAEYPQFNGFFRDGAFEPAAKVHLGNIISLRQGGLLVAAIHDAPSLGPAEMMARLKDQVQRAREGGLKGSEMQDATLSVSNLGDRGADRFQGIIFPPQVALLGLGRLRQVPWASEGKLVVMPVVTLSLAADHRVSDGHDGSRLLAHIDKLLQQPELL